MNEYAAYRLRLNFDLAESQPIKLKFGVARDTCILNRTWLTSRKAKQKMPLQNRVDPFGIIHAAPERSLFMGNRGGRIHDPATKTLLKRRYASRRWIICTCTFKDWHREVMGEGYTELFFMDEVTALAAGHRPCAFCRRDAFRQYRIACEAGGAPSKSVDELDEQLHRERLVPKPLINFLPSLPDGTMIAINGQPYALRQQHLLPWSFSGYGAAEAIPPGLQNCRLLTPPLSVQALEAGYPAQWHPSAGR
jgi:hypothetical protein